MSIDRIRGLQLALAAFAVWRTPAKIAAALARTGVDGIGDEMERQPSDVRHAQDAEAAELAAAGVFALFAGEGGYPSDLIVQGRTPAPILFCRGNHDLISRASIGFCGSRAVSDLGLDAARRCTEAMVERDLTIVSGYARGVDAAAHLAALRSGGSTVFALPEGIKSFRVKRDYAGIFSDEKTLVVSQFSPSQPWQAHAAMARNALIFGLSRALVVIEAGEQGGTLAAGRGALKLGRPVLAVDFGDSTPPGNRMLLSEGATPVRTPAALHRALDALQPSSAMPTDGLFSL